MEEQQMKIPTKKVALYIRSNDPDNESWQLESLCSICQLENKEVVQIYIDRGFSGLNTNRPSLQRLLSDAKDRAFEEVMVTGAHKLTRKTLDLIAMLDELRARGISVSTPGQSLDLHSLFGRFASQLRTAVADYEMSVGT